MACSKNEDSPPDNGGPFKQGTLYYSAADQLTRYDFQSKSEVIVFSGADHYRVSPDARRFMWYKNDFINGTTLDQVHDLSNPEDDEPVTFPYIVKQTPRFIPGSDNQYAALARVVADAIHGKNLILHGSKNN